MSHLFVAEGITKRYGDVAVLRDVALSVEPGEIHALLGANGAGKSTLCKIIAGLTTANSGGMTLEGKPFRPARKQNAEELGVQIVQQELNLIPTLSVAENLMMGRMPSRAGIIRKRLLHQQAESALDRFGLGGLDTHQPVATLGVGRQQMLEIAAALDRECRLLILDEPTAALSSGETEQLFELLRERRGQGVGIIYISHRLDEVAELADRITILRDGRHVCTRDASLESEEMVQLMSGEATQRNDDYCSFQTEEPVLEAEGYSGGIVQDVSIVVHRGERVGIAGLVGSGRTELLRLIFGADPADSGTVRIAGSKPYRFDHPSGAVAAGLAMVTEDRKQNGLLLDATIAHNTSLCALASRFASWLGVIQKRRERETAESMVASMETRCTTIDQLVGTLSGGNQQKVAVSKWLVRDADVFIFDEPTRGIDVAARRRIYRLFDSLAESGKGLLIVSSDLEELMETCDRIVVMSSGRVVEAFPREAFHPDEIMQAAFAGYLKEDAA